MDFLDFDCNATSAVPISYEIRRPRAPCAKALIKDSEQLHFWAISPRFRPCCSKEEMTLDQFMYEFKHKCVDMYKSNNTNVSGEGNAIVFMSTLASRPKEARKDKKLSQESLSRLLGTCLEKHPKTKTTQMC